VFLLVEVAETSAEADREVKVPLYARTGIPEVWLVDLAGESVEVYRTPAPQGYRDVERSRRGSRLAAQALPGLELAVEDMLG
jgi:Uma2 family endonuclease